MIDEPIIGREEYLNSEKFQICNYDWFKQNKLTSIISKVNRIRGNHIALQQTNNIKFCTVNNDNLLAFYKWDDARENELLIIISLDEYHTQQGMLQVPLQDLGIGNGHHLRVTDLITEITYDWYDEWNFVKLNPSTPFHIFKLQR